MQQSKIITNGYESSDFVGVIKVVVLLRALLGKNVNECRDIVANANESCDSVLTIFVHLNKN